MKYVAAYTMCVLSGKDTPSAADVKKVVEAAGGEAEIDEAAITAMIADITAKVPTRHHHPSPRIRRPTPRHAAHHQQARPAPPAPTARLPRTADRSRTHKLHPPRAQGALGDMLATGKYGDY